MGTSVFGCQFSYWLNSSNNCQGKKESIEDELLLSMLTYQSSTEEEEKKKNEISSDQGDTQTHKCLSFSISQKNINISLTHSSTFVPHVYRCILSPVKQTSIFEEEISGETEKFLFSLIE